VTVYRTSSFCSGGDCVGVAVLPDGTVAVRDTKNHDTRLVFTAAEWAAFLAGRRRGEFDQATPA
jgi:hypothetical protein